MPIRLYANVMILNELPFLDYMFKQLQTFCDHVVLMDNGSTDGSREWVEQHGGILNQQTSPPHYGNLRNRMLEMVPDGAWVLKWDPDELPSDAMVRDVRNILESNQGCGGWRIPIYHIFKNRITCLPVDFGTLHLRLFRKIAGTMWQRAIHEQPTVSGPFGRLGSGDGIAIAHFSYFAEARLRRKAQHYATVPHSGFYNDAARLTDRLNLEPTLLPKQITYQASDEWIEMIRRAE